MSPLYRYRARDGGGRMVREKLEAPSRREALGILEEKGLAVLDLREARAERTRPASRRFFFRPRRAGNRELVIFCRQAATMLRAGVPLLSILRVLGQPGENPHLAGQLQTVSLALEEGAGLAGALRRADPFFPPLLVNMVEAGEAGGILEKVMEELAEHYQRRRELEEKVRSATAYPLLVTFLAFLVLLLMVFYVLPQFAAISSTLGLEPPLYSRLVLEAGSFLSAYRLPLLTIPALLAVFIALYGRTAAGKNTWDNLLLRLPLAGPLCRLSAAASFSRTLGALLASGVTLHHSLELTEKILDHGVYGPLVARLSQALGRGESLAQGLDKAGSALPALLTALVRSGEESGSLDQTLAQAAAYYEQELTYRLERLGTVIEPLLLLFVGLIVGLLVYSLFAPIYELFQVI